ITSRSRRRACARSKLGKVCRFVLPGYDVYLCHLRYRLHRLPILKCQDSSTRIADPGELRGPCDRFFTRSDQRKIVSTTNAVMTCVRCNDICTVVDSRELSTRLVLASKSPHA